MKKEIKSVIKHETWILILKDEIVAGQRAFKKNSFIRLKELLIIRSLGLRLDR